MKVARVADFCVERRDHDLIAKDLPVRPGAGDALGEPALLLRAEHRSLWIIPAGTGDIATAVTAGLVAAILATVKHVEVGEPAPFDASRDVEIGPRFGARHANRLVLPPRLIGGSAARVHLLLGHHLVLAHEPGVVVVDFVIIPRDEPWRSFMR